LFQFNADFARDYYPACDIAASRELNPQLMGFTSWARENAGPDPVELIPSSDGPGVPGR
jgi:hypothetical protein